jgi:hypothetical protein
MSIPPISSQMQPYGVNPTMISTPQKTAMMIDTIKGTTQGMKQPMMSMYRPEEAKGGMAMQPPSLSTRPPSEVPKMPPSASNVPAQLARDFLSTVKKGNIAEIQGFISISQVVYL